MININVPSCIKYLYPQAEFIYEFDPEEENPILTFNDRLKWFSEDIEKPTYEDLLAVSSEVDAQDQLNYLRTERNARLRETDWMANSDVTMSDEWRVYRQALRDITTTYSSLDDVVWPTKPD